MKKSYIFIFCLLLVLFVFLLFLIYSNQISLNIIAPEISFIDITKTAIYGTNEYENGSVIFMYTRGHISNTITIIFKSYRPYETVDMYGSDEALYIVYTGKPKGERTDFIFHIEGFYGMEKVIRSEKDKRDDYYTTNKSNIHININGKWLHEDKIYIEYGIE